MVHNPNPFDIVPFAGKVNIISKDEFASLEERWSGYLTVELKTLTPLHIVGQQDGNGRKISSSTFYRQDNTPVIPGSSIKGMLRSFVETITSGWLSQVNEEYPKINGKHDKKNGRHIGFKLFDDYPDPLGRPDRKQTNPAVPAYFKASPKTDILDVASWMFGHVGIPKDQSEADAIRGRVYVEDAVVDNSFFDNTTTLPDIEGPAFMGGGKLSASSWWYFEPHVVRMRSVGHHKVAEFVGQKLRGRKFYYHQQPGPCLEWYKTNWAKLNETINRDKQSVEPLMYTYPIETMVSQKSANFRVYLKDIPTKLLALLCICLDPGATIRHKLGFGKAFGYGSVEFSIKNAMLRPFGKGGWPEPLTDNISMVKHYTDRPWRDEHLVNLGLKDWIEMNSVHKLAQILAWDSKQNILFTYPPFNNHNDKKLAFGKQVAFDQAVNAVKATKQLEGLKCSKDEIGMNVYVGDKLLNLGDNFASAMFNDKHPVNLLTYQKKSIAWEQLKVRKP